ncbi:MAG: hypothetical protein AMXMBFR12_07180 [Candidatus Babeliales bacterium]
MKIIAAYIGILSISPVIALQKDRAPLDGNRFNQPNRFKAAVNRFKPHAQQSVPAHNATLQCMDDVAKLTDEGFALMMSGDYNAEKHAALLKKLQDVSAAQDAAFEKERLAQKAAHEKEMAAINAVRAQFDEEHNARMAELDALRATQEIQHKKEREAQRIAREKHDAELAANDVAFKQKMAALRAQYQLP